MLIDLNELSKKYNLNINGVIHIGAHLGEEAKIYTELNINEVIWIEGNPSLILSLEENLKKYPDYFIHNLLVSDKENEKVTFNITNDTQASSILKLKMHKVQHPTIKVKEKISLRTKRIDNFIKKSIYNIKNYNFLNLDIQGTEYNALVGCGNLLKDIDYIYTEANVGELYEGAKFLSDLDQYLGRFGFIRMELKLTDSGWGDAFYCKSKMDNADIEYEISKKIGEAKSLQSQFKEKSKFDFKRKIKSFIKRVLTK